jgi:hypothetical protein
VVEYPNVVDEVLVVDADLSAPYQSPLDVSDRTDWFDVDASSVGPVELE